MSSFLNFTGLRLATLLLVSAIFTTALRYDPEQVHWNLNQNETAVEPLHYAGRWANHDFNPSPDSWRFPFYVVTLDRFADGDPTNNDANGTVFEHDFMANQFRFGGDTKGLQNSLDYIQGMGFKVCNEISRHISEYLLTNITRLCTLREVPSSTCHGLAMDMALLISLYLITTMVSSTTGATSSPKSTVVACMLSWITPWQRKSLKRITTGQLLIYFQHG